MGIPYRYMRLAQTGGERMEQGQKQESAIPPYVPYKTFKNFIEGLRVAMPARIDRSIMRSYSGAAQSQIMVALKYLGLLSHNDVPTEKLTRLISSDGPERQKALKDILVSAYPAIFRDGFNLQNSTPRQLAERFEDVGATGDTVRRCIAFFVRAASDAGVPISPHISVRQRTRKTANQRPRRQTTLEDELGSEQQDEEVVRGPITWQQMMLSKFPTFDPTWESDVQAKWFESFQKLMKTVEEKQ